VRGRGGLEGAALFAAITLAGAGARAQPIVGAPSDIDTPISGAGAWATRAVTDVAAGPMGALVTWFDFDSDAYAPRSDQLMLVTALAPSTAEPPTFARLPYHAFYIGEASAAWTGAGFVVAYHDGSAIVVVRIDAGGRLLHEIARVLVPAAAEPMGMELVCDAPERCLLTWSSPAPGTPPTPAALEALGFGWEGRAGPVHRLAENDTMWERPGGMAAPIAGRFLVAFSKRRAGGLIKPERSLFVRSLSASGEPLADAIELPVGNAYERPQLVGLGDGLLLVWRVADGAALATRAVRLDPDGALVGSVLYVYADATWSESVYASSEGDAVVVFHGDGATQRIDATGRIERLPFTAGRRPVAVAQDGSAHWLVAGADDVWASRVDMPPARSPEWRRASAAPNSHRNLKTAVRAVGAPHGIALWEDNRSDTWEVFAAPFGPDGCPLRLAQRVLPAGVGAQAIAADEIGFSLLGAAWDAESESTRWTLQRLAPDATPLGEPRPLEGLGSVGAVQANVGGGFTGTGDDAVFVLDAEGVVTATVGLPPSLPRILGDPVSVATENGVVVISQDGTCNECECWDVVMRLDFLDRGGSPWRAAVLEPGATPVGYPQPLIFATSSGYVVAWHGGPQWRAGVLSARGEWSGFSPSFAMDGDIADMIPFGDELWWVQVRDRRGDDPGTLSLRRTTTTLEPVATHDLALAAPAVERAGALVPGIRMPTLLTSRYELLPRGVRVAAIRLDGSECELPLPLVEPVDAGISAPGGDAGPGAADAGRGGVPGGGGCGCRASTRGVGHEVWLAALLAVLLRAVRSRRLSRRVLVAPGQRARLR